MEQYTVREDDVPDNKSVRLRWHQTLTQFSVAHALLLHLAFKSTHFLEPSLLLFHVLPETLQLLLFRSLLLLHLVLLLQVAQPLLL